ncbi:MAG: adenylate/guanylate cyclase domain-containing protein [Spirochaetaceae bacterium]|jgi:class 3 adenylate cyclase|nr:adenylate/guanylate cyclase domain-containing protein [Spirochaetaceae bacterium]
MRVGVPFPLKTKSLLITAGILVPLLAALNGAAWFYGFSLPIERLVSEWGISLDVDRSALAAYPSWLGNIALSAAILFIGLVAAGVRASFAAQRIVRLINAVECFEDGHFDIPVQVGRGSIAALEKSLARMGRSLAVMRQFVNKNAVDLARKDHLSPTAESPDVTLAVFRINNYHKLAPLTAPERMNELVNEFLARIVPAITKTGGAVNKTWTIDDFYVLAVWGDSSLTPDLNRDAIAALRSCVLVRSVVKTMNRDTRIRAERAGSVRYPQFNVAMGLDSGEALVGPAGTSERKEYSILGEVVKNAVRSTRIGAKTGRQIVMTERTFNLGGTHFIVKKLPGKNAAYFSLVKPVIGAKHALP